MNSPLLRILLKSLGDTVTLYARTQLTVDLQKATMDAAATKVEEPEVNPNAKVEEPEVVADAGAGAGVGAGAGADDIEESMCDESIVGTIIRRVIVKGHVVTMVLVTIFDTENTGGKMQHGLESQRDWRDELVYVDGQTLPEFFRLDLKWNGSACAIRVAKDGTMRLYMRLNVKPKKLSRRKYSTTEWGPIPVGAVPCSPPPTPDSENGIMGMHWSHWIPVPRTKEEAGRKLSKNDIRQLDAFSRAQPWLEKQNLAPGFHTCEMMGFGCNQLKCDGIPPEILNKKKTCIIPHGRIQFIIPKELQTPEGLMAILDAMPTVEGFIMYVRNDDGSIALQKFRKDRRRVEKEDGKKFSYPPPAGTKPTNYTELAMIDK